MSDFYIFNVLGRKVSVHGIEQSSPVFFFFQPVYWCQGRFPLIVLMSHTLIYLCISTCFLLPPVHLYSKWKILQLDKDVIFNRGTSGSHMGPAPNCITEYYQRLLGKTSEYIHSIKQIIGSKYSSLIWI